MQKTQKNFTGKAKYFAFNSPWKTLSSSKLNTCTLEAVTKLQAFFYLGSLQPYQKVPEQHLSIYLLCKEDLLCVKEKALLSPCDGKLRAGMGREEHTCCLHLTVCPAELKYEPQLPVMISSECSKTLTVMLKTQIGTRSKGTQILGGDCRHLQPQLCQLSYWWHCQLMQPVLQHLIQKVCSDCA